MNQNDYEKCLGAWERAKFSPPPEPPLSPTAPTMIVDVKMRDGVRLYTEIFLPEKYKAAAHSYPVILSRSPYPFSLPSRHDRRSIKRYLAAGYACAFQLTRGQGKSEGVFRFFRDDISDGYDTIEWIADQYWCDGSVGMEGSSYQGSTQLLAARAKPPALKCIMPTAFVGNFFRSFPFANGVPMKAAFMQWLELVDALSWDGVDIAYGDMTGAYSHPKWGKALRKQPLIEAANDILSGDKLECWRDIMIHLRDDTYWAPLHFTDEELMDLDIPMFMTDGWYDMTIGPIDFFTRMEQLQPKRDDRYLLIGPWNHAQTFSVSQPGDDDGDRVLPINASLDLVEQRMAFYDRYLKNKKNVTVQEDRVKIYITGAPDSNVNTWFNFPTFPVPETQLKRLFLHSGGNAHSFPGDGSLQWGHCANVREAVMDQYFNDPSVPIDVNIAACSSQDMRSFEMRADVLTYTSEPFVEVLTIVGEILLNLHAASDAPDVDWFALLTEVFPDGNSKSFHYAPRSFRARYREGFDKEVLLEPNKPEVFQIPMGPAGHQIAVGNRLRLSITSSAFAGYDSNHNTGEHVALDTQYEIARQTIFHSPGKVSHIVLPVIELNID